MAEEPRSFIAECFWPGVDDAEVEALDGRALAAAGELAATGEPVRYLGAILVRDDEVVLCQFEGTAAAVRRAADLAEIPFERILETTRSPWRT
jgi:hypothetical protein